MCKLFLTIFSLTLLLPGCASWSSAPRVATNCSPDTTWSIALASLQEFELRRIDKENRVIETDWIAVRPSRLSGLTERDLNEERARFILTIEPEQGRSIVSVKQIREFWSPQGVQSRSWRQIPPNEQQERQLAARIQGQLKREPC
ncbi:MAG: hypothetical protein ACPGYT_13785 [Nitrospirales bacterium]